MNWLLLTTLAILARGSMSIATKLCTNRIRVSPSTMNALFMGLAALLVLAISPFIGGLSFRGVNHQLLAVSAIIALQCIANTMFFRAQAELEAGVTQIAFSSILLWSALLSIFFLHTRFSLVQFGGIALLLGAIVLAQYTRSSRRINPAIILIVVAAAMYAAFQIISAQLSKHVSTAAYLILAYAGTAIVLIVLQPRKFSRELKRLAPQFGMKMGIVLFTSCMSVLYFTFSYLAYQRAPSQGTVAVILTAQVVVAVVLGMIFLKERTNKGRKLVAAFVALLAGILIKA